MEFWNKSMNMLRPALDKVLDGSMVRGALAQKIGRYAELLSLRTSDEGGIDAVLRLKGFAEEVRVHVRKLEFSADGSQFCVSEAWASREGVQALLEDFVLKKRWYNIPESFRPAAGLVKKFFE